MAEFNELEIGMRVFVGSIRIPGEIVRFENSGDDFPEPLIVVKSDAGTEIRCAAFDIRIDD